MMARYGPSRSVWAAAAALVLVGLCWGVPVSKSAEGGPDGFGYVWFDQEDGCPQELPSFTSNAEVFDGATDALGPFPLGFPFRFLGEPVTQVWVSPTGFLTFSDQSPDGASDVDQAMPDPVRPNHLIAAYWGDLFANRVLVEGFPDRLEIQWVYSGPAGSEPVSLSLLRDGSFRIYWIPAPFGSNRVTVGYEDASGGAGTTYWRDGIAVEAGFPAPSSANAACFRPPARLDCAAAQELFCDMSLSSSLPAGPTDNAEVYPCDAGFYPGEERVFRLDLATPSAVDLTLDDPSLRLFQVASPPDCTEGSCLASGSPRLTRAILPRGEHWFVVDKASPGGGDPFQITVDCLSLPSVDCGGTGDGDTRIAPSQIPEHSCAPALLDGAEWGHRISMPTSGHLQVWADPPDQGLWVVLHDDAGECLAAGPGGAALFEAAAGEYLVVVDSPAGAESPYTLHVQCGVQLDCGVPSRLDCSGPVAGETTSGPADATLYACGPQVLEGAAQVFEFHNPVRQRVEARLGSAVPGQRILRLAGCDEGTCEDSSSFGFCEFLDPGNYPIAVDGPASAAGPFELALLCDALGAGGPNLVPGVLQVEKDNDPCSLTWSGFVRVPVTNLGDEPVPAGWDVVVFHDRDGSEDYEGPPTDDLIGTVPAPSLAPGETRVLPVPVSGGLLFRDEPVWVKLDPADVVSESEEGDNLASSRSEATACLRRTRDLRAAVEWEWRDPGIEPAYRDLMSTPVVAEINGDGVPDVVLVTQRSEDPGDPTDTACGPNGQGAVVRVLSGDDGRELWAAPEPARRGQCFSPAAAVDLDGDGRGEIVVPSFTDPQRLLALDDDGTVLWLSDPHSSLRRPQGGAAAVGDVDGDGRPEISWGRDVFRSDGSLFWIPDTAGTEGGFTGPMSFFVDLDLDGVQELVAGPTAYRWNPGSGRGEVLWRASGVANGFHAAGNFDEDPEPEILVSSNYTLRLLEGSDGSEVWNASIPQTGGGCPLAPFPGGGAPAVGDLDGDGEPEIVVAGGQWVTAFEANGGEKWRAPIDDCSSGNLSLTLFDLDGDGSWEVVFRDQVLLRVLDGRDGSERLTWPATSLTLHESPIVADVDADGQAEILVPRDEPELGVGDHGLLVLGGAGPEGWAPARPVWNQFDYHITNIEDSLQAPVPSSPTCDPPSLLAFNVFRGQEPLTEPAPAGVDLTLALFGSEVVAGTGCDAEVRLIYRIGNAGDGNLAESFDLVVYEGDPDAGGVELGRSTLPGLGSGGWLDEEMRVTPNARGVVDFHARLETVSGGVVECRFQNNVCITQLQVEGTISASEPSALDRDPGATPLRVARLDTPAELRITWEDLGPDHSYDLYRGVLGDWYTHGAFGACGLVLPEARFPADSGSRYFLVVGVVCDGADVSSYGRDSDGRERPDASSAGGAACR